MCVCVCVCVCACMCVCVCVCVKKSHQAKENISFSLFILIVLNWFDLRSTFRKKVLTQFFPEIFFLIFRKSIMLSEKQ